MCYCLENELRGLSPNRCPTPETSRANVPSIRNYSLMIPVTWAINWLTTPPEFFRVLRQLRWTMERYQVSLHALSWGHTATVGFSPTFFIFCSKKVARPRAPVYVNGAVNEFCTADTFREATIRRGRNERVCIISKLIELPDLKNDEGPTELWKNSDWPLQTGSQPCWIAIQLLIHRLAIMLSNEKTRGYSQTPWISHTIRKSFQSPTKSTPSRYVHLRWCYPNPAVELGSWAYPTVKRINFEQFIRDHPSQL